MINWAARTAKKCTGGFHHWIPGWEHRIPYSTSPDPLENVRQGEITLCSSTENTISARSRLGPHCWTLCLLSPANPWLRLWSLSRPLSHSFLLLCYWVLSPVWGGARVSLRKVCWKQQSWSGLWLTDLKRVWHNVMIWTLIFFTIWGSGAFGLHHSATAHSW